MAFFDPINCFIVVFFIVKEVKSEESCSGTTSGFQVVHNLLVLLTNSRIKTATIQGIKKSFVKGNSFASHAFYALF